MGRGLRFIRFDDVEVEHGELDRLRRGFDGRRLAVVDHQRVLASHHADVDLRHRTRIQSLAVQRPVGIVDLQLQAQGIQRIGFAREQLACPHQAVVDFGDVRDGLGAAKPS